MPRCLHGHLEWLRFSWAGDFPSRLQKIEVHVDEALKEIRGCLLIQDNCPASLSRNFCLPSFSQFMTGEGIEGGGGLVADAGDW
jgi:hypothetical protein